MADTQSIFKSPVYTAIKPFLNGGVAGMAATCCIQPVDMVKVRIQLGAAGSPFSVAGSMIKQEGFFSLYKGLSAGLLRQATYTTARMGIFRILTDTATEYNGGKPVPLVGKAAIGLTAGALGALVGNPADLSLIRMQADSMLPPAQRRNYTNAFQAMGRIVKDEGVLALWKGAGPTVSRAMALNMGMMASFDQTKEMASEMGLTGKMPVVVASAVSGFFASACSLPFDYVKTQIQKQSPGPDGKLPFKSPMDCALQTLKAGGPLKFYTGFPTYVVRIAPHVMLTWIFVNEITNLQKKYNM
eukprot:jgi/Mesvir1/21704/Mv04123-RA.1